MDDLEITIVLKYNVPEKGLTFNGLLRGLEKDRDAIMRSMLRAILEALENQALAAYQEVSPGRYVRNGRQPNLRRFLTSFGELRYRLAQMMDHRTGAVFCPLAKRLAIIPYRQYQGESLEGGIGQAVHLSYRLAASETRRLFGHGPDKSTLHRHLQELAEDHGAWPALKHRPFKFLMVDGTKVALQERGRSLGHSELRWALASEDVGRPFSLVGFWVNQNWESIRRELSRRLNYSRLRVLFSDGDPGIENYLLLPGWTSNVASGMARGTSASSCMRTGSRARPKNLCGKCLIKTRCSISKRPTWKRSRLRMNRWSESWSRPSDAAFGSF